MIAAKCPVHRTLEGEVAFDERVELAERPGRPRDLAGRAAGAARRRWRCDVHGRTDVGRARPAVPRRGRRAARRLHQAPRRPARHPGEISFPGGRQDPGRRRSSTTALREAHEEIGLPPERRRAARRAAADADVRHQLRDLPLRRADRARLRVGAAATTEVAEVLELSLRRRARRLRRAPARAPRDPVPHATPTRSATTSSGARPAGSSPDLLARIEAR